MGPRLVLLNKRIPKESRMTVDDYLLKLEQQVNVKMIKYNFSSTLIYIISKYAGVLKIQ